VELGRGIMSLYADKDHQRLHNAYKRGLKMPTNGHPHILVAAMPKSGSSYLCTLLQNIDGMERVAVVAGHDRREHELALEPLLVKNARSWVAQAHVRYSTTTERCLRAF